MDSCGNRTNLTRNSNESGHKSRRSAWPARVVACLVIAGVLLAVGLVPASAAPVTCTWTIPAGTSPSAVAVNETTNRTYVVNSDSDSVTVIDGSGATTTVATETVPVDIAVNETTNKAYVANHDSDSVTVIDGVGATTTIAAGNSPRAVAVNESTNKAYVVNEDSDNVTVIDGSGATTTVAVGDMPRAVAVNETTNMAYVSNVISDSVTVIDGSGATTPVAAGNSPYAVAVNETTNRAYVVNVDSDNVTVVNGSGATTTVAAGDNPYAVAVDETTDKAYVANVYSNNVTVIDGLGAATNIAAGTTPRAVAVNEITNKAYVVNADSDNVTVIDGSGLTTTVVTGTNPCAVAVSEAANRAYVSNVDSNNVTVIDESYSTTNVPASEDPQAVAVNETTNRAYVANYLSNSITVIDGLGLTTTVAAGTRPRAIAINETTNEAYVANESSDSVTVVNGSGATTTVAAGNSPYAVAVNETTNRAYIANAISNDVTVIDSSGPTTTVATGIGPQAVAVNETTNRAYVANYRSNNLTVIDGSGATTTIATGTGPSAVAVNETTNKAYVANYDSDNVTVIDGSGSTTTIAAGDFPLAVAVNETNNRAYVANGGSDDVTVIDGSGSTTTIAAGNYPYAVAVNETTNRAYVANDGSNNVTVIDGSGAATNIAAGTTPRAVAVNEITNRAYVPNKISNDVTIISDTFLSTLATTAPSAITAAGALSGGNVTSDGWAAVTARGVCWSTSPHPTIAGSHTTDGTGAGVFTSSITGLSATTHYYLRSYATNSAGTSYGNQQEFTTIDYPTLTTGAATSVTPTGATLNGQITSTGGQDCDTRGFQYRKQGFGPWTPWSDVSGAYGTGAFSRPVAGLDPATTYEYQAWAHNSAGMALGSTRTFQTATPPAGQHTWYLAEGTTAWGFSTYISIANPNATAVEATVTYMPKGAGNVSETLNLPAGSQTTLANDHLTEKMGGTFDFSTRVEASDHSRSIAVDRTMSWTGQGAASPEGHSSVGVTSPAKTWYLPEGSTDWGFETWLLIQNPGASEASCDVTYMIEGKGPQTVNHKVPAHSRESYSMLSDIGAADASIKVVSNQPVIPERAMYRNNRREGHDSIGTTTPAADYFLAEGATGYDVGYVTYVLVQNPQNTPADVSLTYMTGSGEVAGPSFQMSANSRKTVCVNEQLPPSTDVSTKVHASEPIIAERAMYWSSPAGEACHDSVGMDTAHTTFYLPDGQTSDGRETWTLVQNPNATAVTVEISYLTPSGTGNVTKTETVPPISRKTFNMATHSGINGRAATMVISKTTGQKIMVERAMYWNNKGAGTDTIGGFSD